MEWRCCDADVCESDATLAVFLRLEAEPLRIMDGEIAVLRFGFIMAFNLHTLDFLAGRQNAHTHHSRVLVWSITGTTQPGVGFSFS